EYSHPDSLAVLFSARDALHTDRSQLDSSRRGMGNFIRANGHAADADVRLFYCECASDAQDAVQGIGGSNACHDKTLSRPPGQGSPAVATQSRPADSVDAAADHRPDHFRIRAESQGP